MIIFTNLAIKSKKLPKKNYLNEEALEDDEDLEATNIDDNSSDNRNDDTDF